MKIKSSKPKGIIAIVSLLIVAGVAMIFSMSMLLDGVRNASLSVSSLLHEDARMNAMTCIEDTLLRVKKEAQFTKNLSYTITDGSTCSTDITWFEETPAGFGKTERLAILDATGVSNNFTRKFRYELRVTKYDVNYSDGSMDYMNTINFISIDEIKS